MPAASPRIDRHGVVVSTQEVARAALEEGHAVDGLVIRAEAQTQGRGRLDRSWTSRKGGSFQTLVFADRSRALRSGRVPIAVAVGIAEALSASSIEIGVKWPNDLYRADLPLRSRGAGTLEGKLGGILCEHVRGHLLVGVGINVRNHPPAGAAALPMHEPEEISDAVVAGVQAGLSELLADPDLPVRFARFDLLAGRWLRLSDGGRELSGRASGLDDKGCLLLSAAGGTSTTCRGRILEIDAAAG